MLDISPPTLENSRLAKSSCNYIDKVRKGLMIYWITVFLNIWGLHSAGWIISSVLSYMQHSLAPYRFGPLPSLCRHTVTTQHKTRIFLGKAENVKIWAAKSPAELFSEITVGKLRKSELETNDRVWHTIMKGELLEKTWMSCNPSLLQTAPWETLPEMSSVFLHILNWWSCWKG